jgi:RNA polymerase sigma-70 factor (ECF subfamily)
MSDGERRMATDQDDGLAQPTGESVARRSDAELVRRSQRDLEAFVDLYDRYVDAVYRYCSRRLPRAAAEDATSTTFLNAIAAIRGFEPERTDAFRSWLFTIARNAVFDQLRRRQNSSIDDVELVERGPSLDELAILSDRRRRLSRAIATLGSDQQQVIHLRLAGLQNPEIGEVLGKSPGAIRVIHHRAVARLRDLLGDRESAGSERTESP